MFRDVCAGQGFGVKRSGGPKVGSSNLDSPTDKPQLLAFELVMIAVRVV
jgi:hypothetical protein